MRKYLKNKMTFSVAYTHAFHLCLMKVKTSSLPRISDSAKLEISFSEVKAGETSNHFMRHALQYTYSS